MRHTKKLISLALLSTLSTGAVYATLTVSGLDNKVYSNPVENTETGNNLVKFKDGENIVKTMFVPDNYSLSLEDALLSTKQILIQIHQLITHGLMVQITTSIII